MKVRQFEIDVSRVPARQEFNVDKRFTFWNAFQNPDQWWVGTIVRERPLKVAFLIILPQSRPFRSFSVHAAELNGHEQRQFDGEQFIYEDPDRRYIFWEIVKPEANFVYRVDWQW